MPKITIRNLGKSFEFSPIITLFNNLAMNGVFVLNRCGGKGICGLCKILVHSTPDTILRKPNEIEKKHLTPEELETGYRLACQTYSLRDIEIEVYGAKVRELNTEGEEQV